MRSLLCTAITIADMSTAAARGSPDDAPDRERMPEDRPMQSRRHPRPVRLLAIIVVMMTIVCTASGVPATLAVGSVGGSSLPVWDWPVEGPREILNPYRAPAHDFAAGHRGVDIGQGGGIVRAPDDGVVAFRGTVVDRPLLTVEHPGGYVSTFEPVVSELSPGEAVTRGDPLGTVGRGGHSATGTLHVGVRLDGVYLNPLLLFGPVPRAVLLPCCDPL
ncbi:M23 family metallopeptidase [uncultured Microbacterium sp.]|uniref:murein hydrolase activator EnvC family protein n=1 Tax=uncultured Microbacterium sp. TaxID=191216 RepID=UPI0028D20907|nr:M23 family metallopeptidase [uncultured Microbacterium sp.]